MLFDWSRVPGVTRDPNRRHGAVTFTGTRVPVSLVFAAIGRGGLDALVEQYGMEDERESIEALFHFLAESCEAEDIDVQAPTPEAAQVILWEGSQPPPPRPKK